MNWSKNLYVFMLGALIVFSGCFGTGMSDGEGDDADTSGTTVINNYYNQSTNQPPIFHITDVGLDNYDGGKVSTYDPSTGEELSRMYHATFQFWFIVTDIDSNITDVGLDLDLDQVIDHHFINNDSWSNFSYHESPGFAQSNGSMANMGHGEWAHHPRYCYATFNLIALDDDGGSEIIPYAIRIDEAVPHDADGCQDDYTGVEENW